MTAIPYRFQVKDAAGNPVTGLTLSWSSFLSVTSTAATPVPITPQPTFTERGLGWYEASYDPYTNGEAFGRINLGTTSANIGQYVDVSYFYESPIQPQDITAIAAAVWNALTASYTATGSFGAAVTAGGSSGLTLAALMNATLSSYTTAGTVGAALNNANKLALNGSGYVTLAGNVTVGGYATGQDPGTYVLFTSGNKLLADSNGRVTLTPGEHTNIVTDTQGGLTNQGVTTARAGKLDNLDTNVGSRVATTALPANFGVMAITGAGALTLAATQTFNMTGNITGNVSGSVGSVTGPVTVGGYSTGMDAGSLVWNAVGSGYVTAGSFGSILQAVPSAATNANTLLASAIENGVNVLQSLRIAAAAGAGVVTGAGTNNVNISAANNPGTPRMSATVSNAGNRSAVALTL